MEYWKTIPSLPDFEASTEGRIRRVHNRKNSGVDGIITNRPNNTNYLVASLSFRNKTYTRLVHRLVAEAFLGNCPAKREVNHRDSDKSNNRLENLEYITRSANLIHSGAYIGERNGKALLTEAQVMQIRRLHTAGFGYKRLAKRYSVHWGTIRNIIKRHTWTHI